MMGRAPREQIPVGRACTNPKSHWQVWETPGGTEKDLGESTGRFQLRNLIWEAGTATIIDRGAAALERQTGEMLLRVKILIWGHQSPNSLELQEKQEQFQTQGI